MTQAIDLPAGMPLNVAIGTVATQKPDAPQTPADPKSPPLFVLFNKPQTPFPTVIRGLNFDQLSSYLNSYETGLYRFIVRIWNLMRKRDSHLLSVSSKRFKRVSRLDWEITPMDSSPEAVAQAEFLSDFYSAIPNFKKILRHLMTANANGHAGCEIAWKPGVGVSKRRKSGIDPKTASPDELFETYAAIRAELIKVRSDYFDEAGGVMTVYPDNVAAQGMALPENKFVIHRADDALMIAASILFVMKQISLGQWNQFCDRFGMPGLVGTAPAGSSEASRDTLQKVISNWVSTMATVLPPGYDVKTVTAAVSGALLPAAALVEWCDESQSILWAGGNLTTKSQAGSGTLAGGAQQDQEIELAQDDAGDLAETLDEQLSAPAVMFQFGQPLLCKFNFKVAKAIDLVAMIGVVVDLVTVLGLQIAESDVRAMFGWRKPEKDEEVITPPAPSTTPAATVPKVYGISKEESGSSGIALKASHPTVKPESQVQQQTDAIVAAHVEEGRAAMKQTFAKIAAVVGDTSITSAEKLQAKLNELAGKLPSDQMQQVLHKILSVSFIKGSDSVQTAVEAATKGGTA